MNNSLMSPWVSNVKVLSFDLDDTLWDCAPVIEKAEARLHEWFQTNTPKVAEQHNATNITQRRAEVVESHPHVANDMTLLRQKIIERCLVDAGYDAAHTDEAFDVFYRARSEVVLYENTHSVLDRLREKFDLAVITNGNADLSLIGIDEKFNHFQRASIDNPPKPHRHMFDVCQQAFGVNPSEVAHIGDNPSTDVGGAQAVGFRTVWYNQAQMNWPESQPIADAEVNSLQGLLDLFLPEHS